MGRSTREAPFANPFREKHQRTSPARPPTDLTALRGPDQSQPARLHAPLRPRIRSGGRLVVLQGPGKRRNRIPRLLLDQGLTDRREERTIVAISGQLIGGINHRPSTFGTNRW